VRGVRLSDRLEAFGAGWSRIARAALARAAALVLGAHAALAGSSGLDAFVAQHKCRVAEGLRMIAATTTADRDPFLILAWPRSSPVQAYVQCLFNDDSSQIYCEAQSGTLDPEPGRRPSPAGLAALARLGFDMDASKGNFERRIPVKQPGDIDAIAAFMLSALYSGYEGVDDRPIDWVSPNASEKEAARRCAPIS
jgi:hypothetical protein